MFSCTGLSEMNGNFASPMVFNVAHGTAPGGVDLLVATHINDGAWTGYGIQKTGPGLMVFANEGSYGGLTTVSGGTLQLGDGLTNLGYVMGNIADNATLAFANPYAQTYALQISGSGNLVKSGPGVLNLTGNNAYSGTTTINGGVLSMSNLSNTGANSILIDAGGAWSPAAPIRPSPPGCRRSIRLPRARCPCRHGQRVDQFHYEQLQRPLSGAAAAAPPTAARSPRQAAPTALAAAGAR